MENVEYLKDAKAVANIVNVAVKTGDYSDVNLKLEKIADSQNKQAYVFDYDEIPKKKIMVPCILFIIIFALFALLGKEIYTYSSYKSIAVLIIFISLAFILVDIVTMVKTIRKKSKYLTFNARYSIYENALKVCNIKLIEDLAVYSKQSTSIVIKDLKQAIELKLIPQGHFGTDNIIFMVDDETYKEYDTNRVYYDQYYKKLLEHRKQNNEKSEEVQQILDLGHSYVNKIHEYNDAIVDKEISEKLDKMENVVAMIFHEMEINSNHTHDLHLFLDYYLPTTQKLLETYISLDKDGVNSKSVKKTKEEIVQSMDMINTCFEGILEKFYEEKQMDISSDIEAMKNIIELKN